jgi:hypothetical protein
MLLLAQIATFSRWVLNQARMMMTTARLLGPSSSDHLLLLLTNEGVIKIDSSVATNRNYHCCWSPFLQLSVLTSQFRSMTFLKYIVDIDGSINNNLYIARVYWWWWVYHLQWLVSKLWLFIFLHMASGPKWAGCRRPNKDYLQFE